MKTNYFYRLIWFGCLSICLPILLAGIAYYQYSMHNALTSIREHNQMSLKMIRQFTDKVTQEIENASLQLAMDPSVVNSFNERNYDTDYVAQRKLLDAINLSTLNNDFISDIYYYNQNYGMVISNREGYQALRDFADKQDIAYLQSHPLASPWIYLPDGSRGGYISFVIRIPTLSSGKPQGLLVTQVKASKLNRYFANVLSLTKNQSAFMLDSQHRLMFQTHKLPQSADSPQKKLVARIAAQTYKQGDFTVRDARGNRYLYSYLKSPTGSMYVSVIPYQTINNELNWIRLVTAGAVLLLILSSLILIIFTLKWAYHPIKKLVDYLYRERKALGDLWTKSIPTLQEHLLQQWLGENYIDGRTLYHECRKYQIPVDRHYLVLSVKWEDLTGRWAFPGERKSLLTFAVINIMRELLDKHPKLRGYVLHDNQECGTAVLHFHRGDSIKTCANLARQYAESLRTSLTAFLKLQAYIGIGHCYNHVADTRLSYNEAKGALKYRLIKEEMYILEIEHLEHPGKHFSFKYPRFLETCIIEHLQQNEVAKARAVLEEFTNTLKSAGSYAAIRQSYYLLLSALVSSLEQVSGGVPAILEHDYFEQFRTKETTREIADWFTSSVFPTVANIANLAYKTNGKAIVEEVRQHVTNNPAVEFSLTECAEQFHIAPTYLSRLFKKELGISFLDFITECKMNEARKLLIETDRNIGQIAESLGYSHRSFNRNFKRMLNMTPSDYRVQYK